ncbi:MAG TPA: serine/threonine-protein kinase [Pirellulaceae bacterium]|nr:serine/threonine-protein kinase [Pirellulaceae bacterium]
MTTPCRRCGAVLPAGVDERSCPRCLMGLAFAEPTASLGLGPFVPPSPAELNRVFPQLEVFDLVGQGGMGAVYRARHRNLDRIVALKILPPQLAARPDFAARFEREARALARLNHPNIVNVFDSGRSGDYYYLVMEFVDGVNLRQAILARAIEPGQALSIVPQICEALQYAHDQGVVHRDIKPENILLDRQGRVRIADFGLARMLDADRVSDTLTTTRQVMGTPRYMAPEQIEGAHHVDHRADIYSLGVVFYELLTGELPLGRFDAPSHHAGVDRRLDRIVFRTLEKRPDARYQRADELKTDVETVSRGGLVRSTRSGFREYRSRTTLFGLPFVHIVSGVNPQTGRPAVAKGIIAIGPSAKGALAIGGVAMGFVAIGGVSIGALTIGGTTIGLLGAIGGIAFSLGFALGGGAFGMFAIGGVALGLTAIGGGAFGAFYLSGHSQTGPPPEVLMALPSIGAGVTFLLFWPALLVAYLFSRREPRVETFTEATIPGKPPRIVGAAAYRDNRSSRGKATAAVITTLLLVFGCVTLSAIALIVGSLLTYTRSVVPAPVMHYEEAARPADQASTIDGVVVTIRNVGRSPDWVDVQYTHDGPEATGSLCQRAMLTDAQRQGLNEILQRYARLAENLETPGTVQQSLGYDSWKIVVPPAEDRSEFLELEAKFWDDVDLILNEVQQGIIRSRLHPFPFGVKGSFDTTNQNGFSPMAMGPRSTAQAMPSILGWGGVGGEVQIAKQGSWYIWSVTSQGATYSGNTSELPGELLRFGAMIPRSPSFPDGAIERPAGEGIEVPKSEPDRPTSPEPPPAPAMPAAPESSDDPPAP